MLLVNVINLRTATLFALLFLLAACENDEKAVDALTKKRMSVDEGIQIESFFSSNGKVKAKLTAPLMRNFQSDTPYIEFPKTLHVDFYNDSTKIIESKLTALYGKYRENEKKIFLKDSVVLFNMTGDTLRCRELWWDQNRGEFYTDKPVRINLKDGTTIYGKDGLTASQDFSTRTIYSASGFAPRPLDESFN